MSGTVKCRTPESGTHALGVCFQELTERIRTVYKVSSASDSTMPFPLSSLVPHANLRGCALRLWTAMTAGG
eukprot:1394447-Rhodomonas_salina.1